MAPDNDFEDVSGDSLERFESESSEARSTVSASITGLWWSDVETDETGQFSVDIEYRPEDWVVYPESLVDYLRQYSEIESRPEPIAEEVYVDLAHLLFGSETGADGRLFITIEAETPADNYEVQTGEIQ